MSAMRRMNRAMYSECSGEPTSARQQAIDVSGRNNANR